MLKSIAHHPRHIRMMAASSGLTTPLDGVGPSRGQVILKFSAWIILLIVLCLGAAFAAMTIR